MVKVVIPETKEKIEKQIEALKHVLKSDTKSKDREIHQASLKALEEALEALNVPSNAGRPKTIDPLKVLELRQQGKTQEQIARELNVSLSSVRRYLSEK